MINEVFRQRGSGELLRHVIRIGLRPVMSPITADKAASLTGLMFHFEYSKNQLTFQSLISRMYTKKNNHDKRTTKDKVDI